MMEKGRKTRENGGTMMDMYSKTWTKAAIYQKIKVTRDQQEQVGCLGNRFTMCIGLKHHEIVVSHH